MPHFQPCLSEYRLGIGWSNLESVLISHTMAPNACKLLHNHPLARASHFWIGPSHILVWVRASASANFQLCLRESGLAITHIQGRISSTTRRLKYIDGEAKLAPPRPHNEDALRNCWRNDTGVFYTVTLIHEVSISLPLSRFQPNACLESWGVGGRGQPSHVFLLKPDPLPLSRSVSDISPPFESIVIFLTVSLALSLSLSLTRLTRGERAGLLSHSLTLTLTLTLSLSLAHTHAHTHTLSVSYPRELVRETRSARRDILGSRIINPQSGWLTIPKLTCWVK